MASSPAVVGRRARVPHDGRPRLRARPCDRAASLAATTSARRSSRRRSCGAASTTSARGTAGSTRSTCARAGCAGRARSARRSPRARRSPAARLFIGDYGGRLWAISPRTGATRWARSVNGRVYGTPAVAGGRVFVPVVDRRIADGVLRGGAVPLARRHGRLRLFVARGVGRTGVLRLVQRRLLRRLRGERPRALGRRHRRRRSPAPPRSSTASRTRAASRTGSSASTRAAAVYCCVSGTDITFPCPGTGCAYFSTATLVSMQWSRVP